MKSERKYPEPGGSQVSRIVHPPVCACGCHRAEEFLAEPTAAYRESRRAFLQKTLVGGMTLATFGLLEEEAQADMFRPSAADQKKLGAQAAADVLKKYREVKDERARRFRSVGDDLVSSLNSKERGPWDYSFRVIESKELNAFALPGGPMFMFTGLLDRIEEDDELAAVTGHEMAHVRREHWARQVEKSSKQRLGLGILLGFIGANKTWRDVAGIGSSLLELQYSRGDENQADTDGFDNMVAAGYDPNGMLDLFRTLQSAGGGGGPEFLRSHPLTKDRISRTQERIDKLKGRSRRRDGDNG